MRVFLIPQALFLLSLELFAKNASSWKDLLDNPLSQDITLSENSTLNLAPSSTDALFSHNLNLNGFKLNVNVNVASVTGQANQTTIFQNTTPTSIAITGNDSSALLIDIQKNSTSFPIKSLFNAESGKIIISAPTVVQSSLSVFSIFRSANQGSIVFENSLKIDLSNSTGALKHQGEYYKAMFNIVNASVLINQSNAKEVSLIGDIYSNSGILKANFSSATSTLKGKLLFRGDEFKNEDDYKPFSAILKFSNTASGQMQIKTQGNGEVELSASSTSMLSGSIDTQDVNNIANTTLLNLNFDNASYAIDTTLGGDSSLNANFNTSSSWKGKLTLKASKTKPTQATYVLNFSGSSFTGNISAEGNNHLKATFNSGSLKSAINASKSSLNFDLLNLNQKSSFSITMTDSTLTLDAKGSTYSSDLTLNGNSSSNLTYSVSNISSNITLNDSSSLILALSNSSTLNGSLNAFGASTSLNLSANHSTFAFSNATIQGVGTIVLENSSQWNGKLTINSSDTKSTHQIQLNSNSTFSGNLDLLNTSNINIALTESKINSIITLSQNVKQLDFALNHSEFFGGFTQSSNASGNLVLSNASTWYITQSSSIHSLTLTNNDIIDFTKNFDGSSRTLEEIDSTNRIILDTHSISGNGNFHLYGTLKNNNPSLDLIRTQSLSGNHTIKIYWNPTQLTADLAQENFYPRHIVVAQQNSTEQKGEFVGGVSTVGTLQYQTQLIKVEKHDTSGALIGYEWILGVDTPTPPPTPPTPPTPQPTISLPAKLLNTFYSSPYKILYTQLENLHSRLGDLRNIQTTTSLWVKSNYGLVLSKDSPSLLASSFNALSIDLGADYNFYTPLGRNFVAGVLSVGFTEDKGGEYQEEDEAFLGKSTIFGFGIYDTFLFHSGVYIDSTLRGFFSQNDYSSKELGNQGFHNFGLIASIESGMKFKLNIPNYFQGFFYLKPEVGVALSYLPTIQQTFSHPSYIDYQATLHSSFPFQMRSELDFGKRFEGERVVGDLFVGLGAEYTFNAKGKIDISTSLNGITLPSKNLFNLKVALGGNILINDRVRIYLDIHSKFLGFLQPVFNAKIGVRTMLGNSQPNYDMPTYTSPYTPPLYYPQ